MVEYDSDETPLKRYTLVAAVCMTEGSSEPPHIRRYEVDGIMLHLPACAEVDIVNQGIYVTTRLRHSIAQELPKTSTSPRVRAIPSPRVQEPSKEASPLPEVMRAALTAEEKDRREGFIKALIKATKYQVMTREDVEYVLGKTEKYLAAACERDSVLPTISANYFAWLTERQIWAGHFKERKSGPHPEFPFAAPENKYGMPYSEIYLAHLEASNRPRGWEKDVARRVVDDMGPVETVAFGHIAGAEYEVPRGVKRNQTYLVALWKLMFPGRPYEVGCKTPLSVRFPCHDDQVLFSLCVARTPDETAAVMRKAAYMLGGKEVVLVAVLNADNQAFLCLDFDESVDLESVERDADFSIKSRFQRAWFDLLSVHLEWVRGRSVLITKRLQEMHHNRTVCNFGHMAAEVAAAQAARKARA
ncbi:hypothetical protein GGR53DRAFT_71875 [Hypoxylon sp. FL1150]|nr:hypothetical protein GGR53DRAFT_71875 [Hypoxylon sp. FL1150]